MSTAIVVTSINAPNAALRALAEGSSEHGFEFIVCGDTKSPQGFSLQGCRYLTVEDQVGTGLRFAKVCPVRTYARKNIGYLVAISGGAKLIVETDDDNLPRPGFFSARHRTLDALKAVDAQRVLDSIAMPISDSDGEDGASNDESFKEIPNFNEKLMHVICLNQAIDKYEKELEVLKATKEAVLADL